MVEELGQYYNLLLHDTIIFYQNIEVTSKQHYNDYSAQSCILSLFIPIILVLDIVSQTEKTNLWKEKETFSKNCMRNIL